MTPDTGSASVAYYKFCPGCGEGQTKNTRDQDMSCETKVHMCTANNGCTEPLVRDENDAYYLRQLIVQVESMKSDMQMLQGDSHRHNKCHTCGAIKDEH